MFGCHAKSGGLLVSPAVLALDNATNSAPGFLDSKAVEPGLMAIYLFGSFVYGHPLAPVYGGPPPESQRHLLSLAAMAVAVNPSFDWSYGNYGWTVF